MLPVSLSCVCYRELRSKYKLLARLMDPEEYEKFLTSMKKEKELREKIKQLKRYRKNGLKKMEGQFLFGYIQVVVIVCILTFTVTY